MMVIWHLKQVFQRSCSALWSSAYSRSVSSSLFSAHRRGLSGHGRFRLIVAFCVICHRRRQANRRLVLGQHYIGADRQPVEEGPAIGDGGNLAALAAFTASAAAASAPASPAAALARSIAIIACGLGGAIGFPAIILVVIVIFTRVCRGRGLGIDHFQTGFARFAAVAASPAASAAGTRPRPGPGPAPISAGS